MQTYRHPDVLDYGIDRIKTACNSIALINYAYVRGDSYSTVRGTSDANIIAEVTGLTSADFTVANQGTLGRKVSNAVKTATCVKQSNGTSGQLGFAFLDTVNSKVLDICDEGADKIVYVGDTVSFPAIDINANQPT
jgi:hypothetical protein